MHERAFHPTVYKINVRTVVGGGGKGFTFCRKGGLLTAAMKHCKHFIDARYKGNLTKR